MPPGETPLPFFREQVLLGILFHYSHYLLGVQYAMSEDLPCVRPPAGASPGPLSIIDH